MMHWQEIPMQPNHQAITERFIAACQADERVVAAILGGSYARGQVDSYSDLDLYLITSDAAYTDFLAQRETFLRLLGEPLSLEDFGMAHAYFYIFSDGTEGELLIGRESQFKNIHGGPHVVLLDKKGILTNVEFAWHKADEAEQLEKLREQVSGFWHELGHFTKAMGRGQLWWAYGQLEVLRLICVNLIRLKQDFLDNGVGHEPYFKIDTTLPVEQLAPLRPTYVPMEPKAILQAGQIIFDLYCQLAPPLAQTHGIPYQLQMEHIMRRDLEKLHR